MRLSHLLLAVSCVSLSAAAQWQLQDSQTTADLRGIHSLGGGVAWASGTHGTVLRTEDAGFLWQTCAVPPGAEKLDFRGIQAFDHNTAIVMSSGKGDLSRLYQTTDGCESWKLLFTNPDPEGFWDALLFRDKTTGYLLGDPVHGSFYLAGTLDGGMHWTTKSSEGLRADPTVQGAFAASNSSLSFKDGHVLFASGGVAGAFLYEGSQGTWTRSPLPVGNRKESSGVFSLGDGGRLAVGGDYAQPTNPDGVAAFANKGSWHPATTQPHGYRSSVAYDPAHKTWITVGPNGTDASTDDGRTWHPLHPGSLDQPGADQQWNALSLPYVVGPHGRIGRLRDDVLKP